MADTPDPVAQMFSIEDEDERTKARPDAVVNIDPPADKAALERDEAGKFKGKEEKAAEPKAEDKAADKVAEPAKIDPKAAEKPAEKANDTVPLAKYMEEKRALRAELEARDLTIKQINDRLAAFEKANAPKPAEPAVPDFIEDPKGYVDAQQAAVLKRIEEANKKADASGEETKKLQAAQEHQAQMQRFMTDLKAHETQFIQQNPDYHDALAHIRTVRAAQLREFNPQITDTEIRETIIGEETNLAVSLARAGRDPVQTAYNIAKHYGYQKKAAADPAAQSAPVAKLPEPANKRLPPDQTLGGGAGAADTETAGNEPDPIDLALASLFPRQRRSA